MTTQENLTDTEYSFIQLISCVKSTDEQRNDPYYIPQLEINKKATITVAALEILETDLENERRSCFRSGAGANGVTQGVWM